MMPNSKKTFFRQLTWAMILALLLTSVTLPIPTLAQTVDTVSSVSGNDSDLITINRVWQSTLYDIPFEYNVALDDTAGYAQVLANMSEFADSFAGIYEQNGSMDYCTLEIVWSGDNVTDNILPESLSVSAGDTFPVTLTCTGTVQAPEGYLFSKEIDTSDFTYTLTLHVYETIEDLPQIPLHIPDDIAFYLGTGLHYSPEMPIEEIEVELEAFGNVRFYFLTEDETEVYPTEVQWDLTDIIPGAPGTYTAEATFTLPQQYTLPEEAMPLSVPVHIRDDASLEIYLDSVYSDFWGTVYYGSVYLPKDTEAVEGYLPGYFAYCGENKPDVPQLDALTFTPVTEEDETIYFFEVYGYEHHSEYEDASIYIDLTCMPDEEQQGWYAFYVETAGYTSNYILLNTLQPTTLVENVEGTRGGDTNSNFPDTEQEAPNDNSEPEISATPIPTDAPLSTTTPVPSEAPVSTPTDAPLSTAIPAVVPAETSAPVVTTSEPEAMVTPQAGATPSPVPTSTPLPVLAEPESTEAPISTAKPFMEQDTADGMALSGIRIHSLIQNNNALVVSKNGATAHFSTHVLETLGLAEDDLLSVRLTWQDKSTLFLEVTVNGSVPDTLPQIGLTLQEVPYDTAQKQTITHESGASVNCYENNGYMAFTTNLTGCYVLNYTDTSDTASEASYPSLPTAFGIGIVVLVTAVILLLFFLLHKSRRDKE